MDTWGRRVVHARLHVYAAHTPVPVPVPVLQLCAGILVVSLHSVVRRKDLIDQRRRDSPVPLPVLHAADHHLRLRLRPLVAHLEQEQRLLIMGAPRVEPLLRFAPRKNQKRAINEKGP